MCIGNCKVMVIKEKLYLFIEFFVDSKDWNGNRLMVFEDDYGYFIMYYEDLVVVVNLLLYFC